MRRSRGVVLFALSIAAIVGLTTGASATPGPGGWDNLGNGATPTSSAFIDVVYALNSDAPGVLYAGGRFIDAGGDPSADFLAQWKNGRWTRAVSVPLTASVNAIAYRAGKLYVGGVFVNAGGNPNADFLAVWDGAKWGTVCNATGPPIGGNVLALQIVGSTIYVGGTFQDGAGIASADYLLACDLNTGAPRSTVAKDGEFSGPVYALTADSKGNLYAGGRFGNLAGVPATDNVAYFNASGWHAMGAGPGQGGGAVDSFVRGLTANGTNVYVGTDSVNVAGIPQADHVAKWNGSAWSALGSNAAGGDGWFPASTFINTLTTSGSRVFAAGSFQNANGDKLADMVAEFDGKAWRPVGSNGAGDGPLNANVSALTTFEKQLVAGGHFTNAGGNDLADFLASYPLAGVPPGGGTPPTTTTPAGAAAPPPTGTPTGTVLVNGRPFTGGTIPYRSIVDVTNGRLLLRADTGTLTVRGAGGISAVFVLLRGVDRKRSVVELRLTRGDFSVCPKRKTSSARRIAATTVRQLWGDGKGAFRTRGRYSAATVRGTNWLTADRCDGTFTRVVRGVIQVSDLPLRRQVTVRAGRTYLARP